MHGYIQRKAEVDVESALNRSPIVAILGNALLVEFLTERND